MSSLMDAALPLHQAEPQLLSEAQAKVGGHEVEVGPLRLLRRMRVGPLMLLSEAQGEGWRPWSG